jgi:hypothetical protein
MAEERVRARGADPIMGHGSRGRGLEVHVMATAGPVEGFLNEHVT